MNAQSNTPSCNPYKQKFNLKFLALVIVVAFSGLLTGCSNPGDETTQRLVENAYECKHIEMVDYNKLDSMSGIYSHVAQYTFTVRFKEGEKGAKKFYKNVFSRMKMEGREWETWIQQPKVQDYLMDECSEAGQVAMERMTEYALKQIYDKEKNIRLPLQMPMTGWAEYMPARSGFEITVRRDRVSGEPVYSKPVRRNVLTSGKW